MPQSLLAVIAMMVAIMLTHLQQRSVLRTQLERTKEEVSLQTLGVAQDMLSEVGGAAFDDATIGSSGNPSGPGDLTATANFGSGKESGGTNDMDDYDGGTFTRTRLAGSGTLTFAVAVEVVYADEGDPDVEVPTPTRAKRVTAMAWNTDIPDADTVQVAQSFTCGAKCTGPGW